MSRTLFERQLDALFEAAQDLCNELLAPLAQKADIQLTQKRDSGGMPKLKKFDNVVGDLSWITHNRRFRALLAFVASYESQDGKVWDAEPNRAAATMRTVTELILNSDMVRKHLSIREGA